MVEIPFADAVVSFFFFLTTQTIFSVLNILETFSCPLASGTPHLWNSLYVSMTLTSSHSWRVLKEMLIDNLNISLTFKDVFP